MTAERNFWPGQACQADRRRARQHIVLQDVGITRATLDRYFLAVSRLKPILEQVSSETELDDNISQWVQDEFEMAAPCTWLVTPSADFTILNLLLKAN